MIVSVRRPWTVVRALGQLFAKRKPEVVIPARESKPKISIIGQFEVMMAHQANLALRDWDNE